MEPTPDESRPQFQSLPNDAGEQDSFPPGHLDLEAYKTFVCGTPPGVRYQVDNQATGSSFSFDGIDSSHLLFTVPGLGGSVSPDGELLEDVERSYLDLAERQLAVSQGWPVKWACQYEDDADVLTDLVQEHTLRLAQLYPGQRIVVAHVPVQA